MKVDYIIVGQGLAGSLIAWHLIERGRRVLVVDEDEPATSSKVAAGLATPITGQQFSLATDIEKSLSFAKQTYQAIEKTAGRKLFYPGNMIRLFHQPREKEKWFKRLADPSRANRYADFYRDIDLSRDDHLKKELNGIELTQGGWLNVPEFLESIRQFLLERLAYAIGTVCSRELKIDSQSRRVKWRNIEAKNIIFCQGWKGTNNHFFDFIPMNNARGDILTFRCEAMDGEERIIHRNGWILPLTGNGEFRAGATYDHDFLDPAPTEEGRRQVMEKIRSMINPEFTVLKHESAVRPIISRSTVVMGRHPQEPSLIYFNGMGSKGVINGPLKTWELIQHLEDQKPLAKDNDINQRFVF